MRVIELFANKDPRLRKDDKLALPHHIKPLNKTP